jgi:hypothetical protein
LSELADALLAPGKMIVFLFGGIKQLLFEVFIAGHESLTAIQGLSGDLTGMVNPHQSG